MVRSVRNKVCRSQRVKEITKKNILMRSTSNGLLLPNSLVLRETGDPRLIDFESSALAAGSCGLFVVWIRPARRGADKWDASKRDTDMLSLTVVRLIHAALLYIQRGENCLQHVAAHLHARLDDKLDESYLRFSHQGIVTVAERRKRQSESLFLIPLPEELLQQLHCPSKWKGTTSPRFLFAAALNFYSTPRCHAALVKRIARHRGYFRRWDCEQRRPRLGDVWSKK